MIGGYPSLRRQLSEARPLLELPSWMFLLVQWVVSRSIHPVPNRGEHGVVSTRVHIGLPVAETCICECSRHLGKKALFLLD